MGFGRTVERQVDNFGVRRKYESRIAEFSVDPASGFSFLVGNQNE